MRWMAAGAMASFKHDCSGGRLARRDALFGPLDAVVHAVSNSVVERRFQSIEDLPIHFRIRADYFELRLLAELPRKVSDHSRKALDTVAKRPHTTRHHLAIKAV